MDKEVEKKLRRIVNDIVNDVYSDLAEAVEASDQGPLEPDDFIEPVYNHLIDRACREFGVSSDIYGRVCKFDRAVTELIRDEVRSIVGE